jgi:autoinducer 2-degrading protein
MYVITVNFDIKLDHIDAFRERVLQQGKDSLELETECHRFDVCHDSKQPHRFFLYEIYTDEQAFIVHLASDHFKAFYQDCQDWVIIRDIYPLEKIS